MKALIVGGGIGGPVAAVALQRAGIESVVYEAHVGAAEDRGLFLGLGVNGMRVLRELDLLEPVLRSGTIPTPLMEFSSTTGRRLGAASNDWLDSDTPSVTLKRGVLQTVLARSARERGAAIMYGRRFVDYDADHNGVTAC
jgi:2-polyprenyl-6-methoxyphenol hydroxylase-like FAD-dependent oxidoreductase